MKINMPSILLTVASGLGLGLAGCDRFRPLITTDPNAPIATTTATPSATKTIDPNSTTSAAPQTASKPEASAPVSSPAKTAAVTAASSVQQFASARPPLTVEKLKNAQYYFLAKGPIQLVNGSYEDKETKRNFAIGDVIAYGDINQDGIKDAATSLKVTVPGTGDFSYLVVLVNEAGSAKNISTEFMGARIKVKTLKINADNSIAATMGQYQAGDPDCCPSIEIKRNYKLKREQTQSGSTKTQQK